MPQFPSLILILSLIAANSALESQTFVNAEYKPPGSAQYPYGDEIFNDDLRESHFIERFEEIEAVNITSIYTFCPNNTMEEDTELDEDEVPDYKNQCTKCDLRATVEKEGVLVECFNCTNLRDSGESQASVLYLATFLEIANYSLPDEEY